MKKEYIVFNQRVANLSRPKGRLFIMYTHPRYT